MGKRVDPGYVLTTLKRRLHLHRTNACGTLELHCRIGSHRIPCPVMVPAAESGHFFISGYIRSQPDSAAGYEAVYANVPSTVMLTFQLIHSILVFFCKTAIYINTLLNYRVLCLLLCCLVLLYLYIVSMKSDPGPIPGLLPNFENTYSAKSGF